MLCSDDDNNETNITQNDNELEDEDEGEREAKWRTERLEREKFLEEHKVKKYGIPSIFKYFFCFVS